MHTSRPIEVQGRFLGVAVTHAAVHRGFSWRFIATDPAVEALDGFTFASPEEARRVAGFVMQRSHLPAGAALPPVGVR